MPPALPKTTVARSEPTAAVERATARIEGLHDNPVFIHRVPHAEAMEQARKAQGPLRGLTFAVKDNIDVAGMPTTAGCPAFAYTPKQSAASVQKLLDAGAVLVGKTNLDQFAAGLVGTRSPYGAVKNAFHPEYISGGSSSGSAVAVALGLADFALGTDTAGSGRVPAAFNNIVGLKPTRGLVSAAGVVPACRSLDCVSVFAPDCGRALAVLEAIEGYDAADPWSRRAAPVTFGAGRLRVAVPGALEFYGDRQYEALFEGALARLGGTRVPGDFAPIAAAQQLLYDGPWVAERLEPLAQFLQAHAGDVHPVTRTVLESGRRYSAVEAFQAQHRLAALKRETEAVWQAADVLAVPGAPTIYKISEVEADPIALNSRLGRYTNFVNLLDLAAITLPAGFRADGLPFGITLIGPAFSDRALAALGARFLGEPPIEVAAQTVRVAVVGAHLSGMALNGQLTARGATHVREARTSAEYRLFDLADGRPGLLRDGHGACIAVEVWEMSVAAFGSFVAQIPPPLGIGTLSLEDGEPVKGFLCEAHAVTGRRDITSFGGWRSYLQSTQATKGESP
jgi:allophanate hydrolase